MAFFAVVAAGTVIGGRSVFRQVQATRTLAAEVTARTEGNPRPEMWDMSA